MSDTDVEAFHLDTLKYALRSGDEARIRHALALATDAPTLMAAADMLIRKDAETILPGVTVETFERVLIALPADGTDDRAFSKLEVKGKAFVYDAAANAYAAGQKSALIARLALKADARTTNVEGAVKIGLELLETRPLTRHHMVVARQLIYLGQRAPVAAWIDAIEQTNDLDACDAFGRAQFEDLAQHCPRGGATDDLIHVYEKPGARRVIFTFCGLSNRFGVPLEQLVRWVETMDTHLVVLKDPDVVFYMKGVPGLGEGVAATAQGMRDMAARLGAEEILCMGSSAGGYPAIRYGLKAGATRVVNFAGFTNMDTSDPGVTGDPRAEALLPRAIREVGPDLINTREELARRDPPLPVDLYFGSEMPSDCFQAGSLDGLPGVTLHPIEGLQGHYAVRALDKAGRMPGILADFVEGRPLS